jgi:Ca-activated chloride channel family protein
MRRFVTPLVLLLLSELTPLFPARAAEPVQVLNPMQLQGKIMIIYDSSGSMAGEVRARSQEERKYNVAQREFSRLIDLLAGIDAHVDVGLMAFGHRRRGDCGDIEILSAPESNQDAAHRARLKELVNGLNTRGMTPIASSIVNAARALQYTEQRAIVVLISDGIEECGGNPCQISAELERTGTDFTAHVIGFDLKQQEFEALRCIAKNTGGEILLAENAPALARIVEELALKIAREEWQRQQGRVSFALAIQGFPNAAVPPPEGAIVAVTAASGGDTVVQPFFDGMIAVASLPAGNYRAVLQGEGLPPEVKNFTLEPAAEAEVLFALTPSQLTLTGRVETPELFPEAPPAPIEFVVEHQGAVGGQPVVTAVDKLEQDVPPGSYRVTARYLSLQRVETVDLPIEGREALEFNFGPAKLEAAVVNQQGQRIQDPTVRWRIEPLGNDVQRLAPVEVEQPTISRTLPPGRYRIIGSYGVETASKEIEAIAEQSAAVTLTIFEPK